MEAHQGAARLVDVAQRILGGIAQRLVLELLEVARQRLDQRELAVDHEIDQRIDEIVDAEGAQPGARGLQPVTHRLEDVELVVMEGDNVVLAEEDADLARVQLAFLVGRVVQHDEALALVEVELAPLMGVEHVLERQRMQIECHAEVAQHVRAGMAGDVDPGVAGRAEMEAAFVDLHAVQHLHVVRRVLDQGEVECLVGHGCAPGERAGRRAGLGMAMYEAVHVAKRRCRRQTSCMTWMSGRPAR